MGQFDRFTQQSLDKLKLVHPLLRFTAAEALRLCEHEMRFQIATSKWPDTSEIVPRDIQPLHTQAHMAGYAITVTPMGHAGGAASTDHTYEALSVRDAMHQATANIKGLFPELFDVAWGFDHAVRLDKDGNPRGLGIEDTGIGRRYVMLTAALQPGDNASPPVGFFPAFSDTYQTPAQLRAFLEESATTYVATGTNNDRPSYAPSRQAS